jgi:hypothetical protein
MSRQINEEEPLSAEDRRHLEERGNYALIRRMDEMHGTGPEQEEETEASLANRIGEMEAELNDLRGRQTQLRIAREQQEAGVKDNTVVNGEGGQEPVVDGYGDKTKAELQEEIDFRNTDREAEYQISRNGTRAQLIERLRADDEDDEDDEDEEDEG